jgi:hypothetical protein
LLPSQSCILHRRFTSQTWVCSPPSIHISSMGEFSIVDSHLKHACVLHRWFTSQVCLCSPPLIIQGLGYQIMLRNMALVVHWGTHNWCYSVTGLLSCCYVEGMNGSRPVLSNCCKILLIIIICNAMQCNAMGRAIFCR